MISRGQQIAAAVSDAARQFNIRDIAPPAMHFSAHDGFRLCQHFTVLTRDFDAGAAGHSVYLSGAAKLYGIKLTWDVDVTLTFDSTPPAQPQHDAQSPQQDQRDSETGSSV